MQQAICKACEWLLLTLCRKVRVFTLGQIADAWFGGDMKLAASKVGILEKQGLLVSYTELVSGRLELREPLLVWEPGFGKAPKFSQLAYASRKRWVEQPKRELLVYATTKAINRYAGYCKGKPPATNSLRHDIQIGELYLSFLRDNPKRARRWIGEDEWQELGFTSHKKAVPDCVLRHKRNHRLDVLVEMVGQYGPDRLREFHRDFMGYRYELW